MDYQKSYLLLWALDIIALLLLLPCLLTGALAWLGGLGFVVLAANLLQYALFFRCPHCKKHLGRSGVPEYCPHCGNCID